MSEQVTKVEVKVGPYAADGTFLGRIVRFAGEEVGSYTDYSAASSRDDRGTTYTLYRCPTGYRVLADEWSRWQGEQSETLLYPQDEDGSYYVYTEDEARSDWAHLFAACGEPNVVDLDD